MHYGNFFECDFKKMEFFSVNAKVTPIAYVNPPIFVTITYLITREIPLYPRKKFNWLAACVLLQYQIQKLQMPPPIGSNGLENQ
jgi:hypothetical protein